MKNNALYPAMKDAMSKIIEAEETAVAWRKEIARCKSDLNLIIRTAKKLDPALAEVDTLDIIKALRAEFTPAEPTEERHVPCSDEIPDATPESPNYNS